MNYHYMLTDEEERWEEEERRQREEEEYERQMAEEAEYEAYLIECEQKRAMVADQIIQAVIARSETTEKVRFLIEHLPEIDNFTVLQILDLLNAKEVDSAWTLVLELVETPC